VYTKTILFALCLITARVVFADYPAIAYLDTQRDTVFAQYTNYVNSGRMLVYNRMNPIDPETAASMLTIYEYTVKDSDEFYRLQARCNVGIEGIATLNRLAHPLLISGARLLLPSIPGIFVPLDLEEKTRKNANDLEKLMAGSRFLGGGAVITITRDGGKERFLFLPGEHFSQTEYAFFLTFGNAGDAFQYPLTYYTLTSGFGTRRNPVTGRVKNHDGLDLAAPMGTPVYAAREGVVTETGADAVYGNYVVIRHEDGWASLYGHLSVIDAKLRAGVKAGECIGKVGSTGQSTGPHLHFELRQNGRARDPGKYLFKEGMTQ
jgi:murein DD-endopeptidase MepM/ murein hydrolase activator NlpD